MAIDPQVQSMLQRMQAQLDQGSKQAAPTKKDSAVNLLDVPQGPGSLLNADQVDGIHATTLPMPNNLLPLGPNGKFPTSVVPASGGGGSGFLLGNGAPTDKNVLIADGTLWQSRTVSGDLSITADTGTFHVIGIGNITTGTLGVTHGGTGITACATGDLLLGSGSNTLAVLNIGSNGKVLTSNGTTASWQTPASVSPGGSNTYVQYNDSSAFGGDSGLVWDKSGKTLTVTTGSSLTPLNLVGSSNIDMFMYTGAAHSCWNFGSGTPGSPALKWQVGLFTPSDDGSNEFFIYGYTFAANVLTIRASDNRFHLHQDFLVDGNSVFGGTIKVAGDTTGSTTCTLGTNSPSVGTTPQTWLKFIDSAGDTVYVPAYK